MYIADRVDYSVKDFILKHKSNFPLLAVITQGYLAYTEANTFDPGQILRLHCVNRIPRVKGRITNDHHGRFNSIKTLSFPINNDSGILVTTTKGKVAAIADIAHKGKLPCKIKVSEVYNVHQTDQVLRLDQSVTIVLEELHELQCILGNPVHEVELLDHVIALPEYLPHVRLTVVTGVKGFDQSNWMQLQTYMSDVVENYICFEKYSAIKEIITFSDDITSADGMLNYESLQFSTLERDSEKNNYDIIKRRELSRLSDEPVYAIIPDYKNKNLTMQSAEWKRKLNILSQETLTKHLNPSSDNPPPVPPRKNISVKGVLPNLLPKPVKLKTRSTKIASTGLLLDTKKTAMVQPRITNQNRAKSDSEGILGKMHPINDCSMKDIKLESSCAFTKIKTKLDNSLEDMKPGVECSVVEKKEKTGSGWPLEDKTIADIGEILRHLNLQKYVDVFAKSLIDGAILKECNMDVLLELGLKQIEAIRLLKYTKSGHLPK